MAKRKKTRYLEVEPILKEYPQCRYYLLLGARGCGKTFPVIRKCLKDYLDGKGVFAYIRRLKESITGKNINDLFSPHNKWLETYTSGMWNRVAYWKGRFYLEKWEVNEETGILEKTAKNPEPIGGAWSMNTWETDKGQDFAGDKGGIAHIIVDEVLSKAGHYLSDEWSICQNVISSLVRDRWEKDTKIWMLANPISKWSNPYFRNMGVNKRMIQQPGTTLLEYKDDKGKVTMSSLFVYVAAELDEKGNVIEIDENKTNVYNRFFAFPNSTGKSKSITHGFWEMDDANHLPSGVYDESTKNRTIYLKWDEEILAIDIMKHDATNLYYLFVYPTSQIRKHTYYITLSMVLDKYAIIGTTGTHPIYQLFKKIYNTGQVYYSDDSTADAFHGFLIEARKRSI